MQTAGDEMVRQLRAWQDARWVVKARVSCTLLILGLACVAGSQFALLVGAGLDCGSDTHCPAYPVTWLMLCMGLCICCYAPLSDDTWLARMVLILTAVIMGSEVNWEFCWNRAEDPCPVLGGLPLQGNAAACIAGLLGGCDARQAFAEAAARFRCIDLSMITEEEMATRDPDPVLFKRSVQVGGCQRFRWASAMPSSRIRGRTARRASGPCCRGGAKLSSPSTGVSRRFGSTSAVPTRQTSQPTCDACQFSSAAAGRWSSCAGRPTFNGCGASWSFSHTTAPGFSTID
ncbi:unnamed protein product [Prorocentrum cordatum]|uniref:Uncharacterized protein n=1 Tax=Prorocentrum cordatum TaxID=2364126 RepID=A0ABN9TPM5_9DINO|nr:unnamed protein product [Polarella glacialis]